MRTWLGKFVEWALGYEREILIYPHLGLLPRQGYQSDAGWDLFCSHGADLQPGETTNISTGVYVATPNLVWLEMKSRSSTQRKWGVYIQDAVIDPGYRGELFCIGRNLTDHAVHVPAGERLCQVVPHLRVPVKWKAVHQLPESHRGDNGFGSSG